MKLTLCVICKDEEKKIVRCIQSVKEVVDEIVVVDTGSTDRTIELAKAEGATVYETPWENSFAKARNYALDKVQDGWVIFIDADEYFTESSAKLIRKCVDEAVAHHADYLLVEMMNCGEGGTVTQTFKAVRVFKRDKGIYYVYPIHETLHKNNGAFKEWDASKSLKVLHDGYIKEVVDEKDKKERNEKLLLQELKANPKNDTVKFYLMQNYLSKGEPDKAIEYGKMCIKSKNLKIWGGKELTYVYIMEACLASDKPYDEVRSYYEAGIKTNATYPDFDYCFGLYLYKREDYENCIKYLQNSLDKVGKYKDRIAASATGSVEQMLILQANSFIKLEQYPQAVGLLVKILRINPERIEVLYRLLNIIQKDETAEAIGGFLCKLYDLSNVTHQLVLLKVSQECKNEELYQYFYARVSDEVRSQFDGLLKA